MPVVPLPCTPGGGPPPGGPACCSPSIATTPLCLADGTPILLVLTSECATCGTTAAAPAVTGWLDPATGAFTTGAPTGAGPCPRGDCASVTTARLCDHTPAGECVPFLRHLVHDCDGQVTASTDTALDGITPYTAAGEVIDCADCPCENGTKVIPLCDYTGGREPVTFLRHLTYDCVTGEVIEQADTADDGTTPYTPVGEIGECGQCHPAPMCPQLIGLSGPETWLMPEGTESVSLTVACGPVTVTDCAGHSTQINECGTSFNWGAPSSGGCEPAALCSPFTVDVPDGAAAYITYVSPCGTGDES